MYQTAIIDNFCKNCPTQTIFGTDTGTTTLSHYCKFYVHTYTLNVFVNFHRIFRKINVS